MGPMVFKRQHVRAITSACGVIVATAAVVMGHQAVAAPAPLPRTDAHVHVAPAMLADTMRFLASVQVTQAVNLSGGQAGASLETSLRAARALNGAVKVCTNVNWRQVAAPGFGQRMAADLRRARGQGAACLKVHKALGLGVAVPGEPLMAVDDTRLDPLWQAAGQLDMPVFIHVGDPAAFWEEVTPRNERYDELSVNPDWSYFNTPAPPRARLLSQFERVLSRHRATVFVGVHLGNDPESVTATRARMDRHPNLWVDTAARVGEIGRQPVAVLRRFFLRHQDRIMFGTDLAVYENGVMLGAPDGHQPNPQDAVRFYERHWAFFETSRAGLEHPSPIQGRWKVHGIALPPSVLAKFYARNAQRLLKWGPVGTPPVKVR